MGRKAHKKPSASTPNRLLARIVRAVEAVPVVRRGFATGIYDGQEHGSDMRFDVNTRPAYWAQRAACMKLCKQRTYFIELLEKKAEFYENRLLEFQKEEEGRKAAKKDQLAKAKAAEAAKEAEEAKAANEVKEAKAAEARRAQVEKRARLKADGDELRQMLGDTLQPVPSHKRKRTAICVSPPVRKVWSLFG